MAGRPQAPEVLTRRWTASGWADADDRLAAEEPLQLLIDGTPLSVVMRTPGNDVELALGLLWAERVVTGREQVREVLVSAESGERDAVEHELEGLLGRQLVAGVLPAGGGPAPGQDPGRLRSALS